MHGCYPPVYGRITQVRLTMALRWGCWGVSLLATLGSAQNAFSQDAASILARNCISCHGPAQQMSSLDLSSRAAALKGGQKSGPAIVPGNAAASPLYRRVTGQDEPAMPLGAKLSDADIATLKRWINSGA